MKFFVAITSFFFAAIFHPFHERRACRDAHIRDA